MTMSVAERMEAKAQEVDVFSAEWGGLMEEVRQALGDKVPDLVSSLASEAEKLEQACVAVRKAVEEPRMVLATTGTTSGGKSTLVNFLCGAEIMPVATQEMSAGVVHIHHHPSRRNLRIGPENGVPWETGQWDEVGDGEICDRLREVMSVYRESRASDSPPPPPEIEIEYPTWLGLEPLTLGLPPGASLEFLDLPGLKYVGDDQNSYIILNKCQRALCLVTYNSEETDPVKQEALLAQVTSRVQDLQGSPARMLFILNRIDAFMRDSNWQASQAKFIDSTREAIRSQIGKALPEYGEEAEKLGVLPLSSLPALRAIQARLNDQGAEQALGHIDKYFSHLIPDELLEELPRKVRKWKPIDRKRVVDEVLKSSHANDFVYTLKEHVRNNLPQLLLPQVIKGVVDAANGGLTTADQVLNAELKSAGEDYRREKARIGSIRKGLVELRDGAKERIEPLLSIEEDEAIAVAMITDAATDVEKRLGLKPGKLNALYSWDSALGLALNDYLDDVAAAISPGRPGLKSELAECLPLQDRRSVIAACNGLVKADYLEVEGQKKEARTDKERQDLRRLNEYLNDLAMALAASLPKILDRVAKRESARVKETLDNLFRSYLERLAVEAGELAQDLVGLNVPALDVAKVEERMGWDFRLSAGFTVDKETEDVHTGEREVKVGERRLWYTCWIRKVDVTKTEKIYAKRDYKSGNIPSLEKVLSEFVAQARDSRPGGAFARWLKQQLNRFVEQTEKLQEEMITQYETRLDKAHARADQTHTADKARLEPLRERIATMQAQAAELLRVA